MLIVRAAAFGQPVPALTKSLSITRTNAYKVLDSLAELGLAHKQEVRKKFVYRPADPSALASLVAERRNQVIALEQSVNAAMQQLRGAYRRSTGQSNVESRSGKQQMVETYEQQAVAGEPIYFVKTRADIPFLGFDTMDRLRRLPAAQGTPRYGITPDGTEGSANPEIDARATLTRTWVDSESYTAPVEWTVSGDQMAIQIFEGDGRVIIIEDAAVAGAFRQLWQLTDRALRSDPAYKQLPRLAQRKI